MPDKLPRLADGLAIRWLNDGRTYVLHVEKDNCPPDPRTDYDNICRLACKPNSNYSIGDMDLDGDDLRELVKSLVPAGVRIQRARENIKLFTVDLDYDDGEPCDDEDLLDALSDEITDMNFALAAAVAKGYVAILPVWAYMHSGITISCGERTGQYADRWDSALVGVIYVDKGTVLEAFPDMDPDQWEEKADTLMRSEIETYDLYLTGETYCYQLLLETQNPDGSTDHEDVESCGGFLGDDIIDSGMADEVARGLPEVLESGKYDVGEAKTRTIVVTDYVFALPDGM